MSSARTVIPSAWPFRLAGLVALLLGLGLPQPAVAAAPVPARLPAADPPLVAASWSVAPAQEAATRLLGRAQANRFRFVAEEPAPPGGDHYRYFADRGHIVIGGTSPAVILKGLGAYLAQVAHMDVSWNGRQIGTPAQLPLPEQETFQRANVEHRFAFNDTDDGYTGAYRTWDEWQHTLDILALKGINEVFMPVGTEAVYLDTFEQFGYTEEELLSWIPQPAHQPWWLLQNMCCFPSAISKDVVERRAALGARITARIRELGMTPVLPGYFGTVPPGFTAKNPGASTVPQGGWSGFTRPDWLDPTRPVFADVAKAFYASSEHRLGGSSMYKMDLLHEGGRAGEVDVAAASKAVETALQTAHPGATWAILGWQNNPRPDTISAIDSSKMLILDGLADRYDGMNRERDWKGTPYAFGSIWNFGGHTTMGANMSVWNQRYWQWKAKADSALDGIAVLPEGSENNPVALDFLTSLAWSNGPEQMQDWYSAWATRRYGAPDAAAQRAWQTIGSTAYSMPSGTWSEAQDGLFAAEPSLDATSAATWSPGAMRYDATAFAQALPDMLRVAPDLRTSSAYRYDLLDITRQVLSNSSRELLPRIKTAYDAKDRAQLDALTEQWIEEMRLLEKVSSTNEQTMLGPWLQQVRSWATAPEEVADLTYDARSILTTWGTRSGYQAGLKDYANREWAGLISTYYLPRWQKYFDELDAALTENRPPRDIDWFAYGDAWAKASSAGLSTRPHGDIVEIAGEVLDYLRHHPAPASLTAQSGSGVVAPDQAARVTLTVRNPDAFASLTDLDLSLQPVDGLTVHSVGDPAPTTLGPGQSATATYDVSLTDGGTPALVSALPAHAAYTLAGTPKEASAQVRLMTADGVQPPNDTVSFNDAQFGQRGEQYAIVGAGADMWGSTNQFGSIYRAGALRSGRRVTTQVTAQDRTGPWARAGIVVRDSLTTQGSTGYLNLALTPDHGCVLSYDSNSDGQLDQYANVDSFHGSAYLRLSKNGDQYTGECSTDGTSWVQVGSTTVTSAAASDVGLFMTAAGSGRGLVQFDGFTIDDAPPPSGPPPGTHYLSDLPFASSIGGHGPWERDMHNGETAAGDGGPITLNGTVYAKGLGSNAQAEATFYLGGTCTRFTALVGIDDTMNRPDAHGDVAFHVYADDQEAYASGTVLAGQPPHSIDVDTTGARVLRLVVDQVDADNYWDRADWADAKIVCG